MREPRRRPHASCAGFFRGLGPGGRRGRAGRRGAGGAVPQPRHDVRRARRRARRASRTRSAPARRRSTRRSRASRSSGRSCATASCCSASCARASRALRGAAPDLADAFEIGTPHAAPLGRAQPSASIPTFRALQALRRGPADVARRQRPAQRPRDRCNPTVADLAPIQTVCNYVTLWFRNVASLLSEGDDNGTWQRFIIVAAPHGPEQRGRPVDAPGQRRRTPDELPALQPVPEHAGRRAARTSARPATSRGSRAAGHRQRARQPGHGHRADEIIRDSEGSLPSQRSRRAGRRARTTDGRARASRARTAAAPTPCVVGVARARRRRDRHVPRLHEGHPVHAGLPGQGGLRVARTSIRANSPVRIAGVNVGKVKKIERYEDTDMAVVEMEIKEKGLPIHKDATLKIRPRIFLEGNFFVDL